MLFVAFVALNLFLWAQLGPNPRALQRYALIDVEAVFGVRSRLEAVRELISESTDAPAVLLGLSSAREGVDPNQFTQETGGSLRLLNLAWSGGSFRELAAYSEPFLVDELTPPMVFVGAHPSWLVGRTAAQAWPGSTTDLRKALSPVLWSLQQRTAIHAWIESTLLNARCWMASRLGWARCRRVNRADVDPWHVKHLYAEQRAPAEFWDAQAGYWQSLGWFDETSYRSEVAEIDVVSGLFERLRERASLRILILLPESASFRLRVPDTAVQLLTDTARSADPELLVIDLRDAIPDTGFRDHAHLNDAGRHRLSTLLGELARSIRTSRQ